jgi:hypothetical protein
MFNVYYKTIINNWIILFNCILKTVNNYCLLSNIIIKNISKYSKHKTFMYITPLTCFNWVKNKKSFKLNVKKWLKFFYVAQKMQKLQIPIDN